MIKRQHFVALAASMMLVLSGCETTDSLADGFPFAEEENTVIELENSRGTSGSIKLPVADSSDDEEAGNGSDEENENEESENQTTDETNSDDENASDDGTGSDENTSDDESSSDENAENGSEEDGNNESDSSDSAEDDVDSPSKNVTNTDDDSESTEQTEESADNSDKEAESGETTEEENQNGDSESTDGTTEENADNSDKETESGETTEEDSQNGDSESTDGTTEENADNSDKETESGETTEEENQNGDSESTDGTTEENADNTDKEAESGETTEEDSQNGDSESTDGTTEENADNSDKETESGETTEEDSQNGDSESTDDSTGKTDGNDETSGSTGTKTPEEDNSGEKTEDSSEETVPEKDYSANNKILMQKVENARQAAIDAGASSAAPTVWAATEGIYKTEKAAVESGTKADLSTVLNDLIARYNGLENVAQAKDLKDEIDENNFASFRQATYDAGSEILSDLTNPLSVVQSGVDFNKKATTAEQDFRLVLRTAYNSLAQNERTAAYEAKLKADSVKAYVSRKDEYTHAVSLYRNGELRRSVDPKLANDSYKLSKEEFLKLYEEISAARAQAQKEIDEAKKSVAQSAGVAEQADVEAPLGNEPVEGIEAEDAKLLEDDDFSDAGEAAEIEAPVDEQ